MAPRSWVGGVAVGNGIQHIFEEDGSVLYASLHRYGHGFYPGTGGAHAVGEGAGRGFSLNIPWSSAGYGDAEYAAAFERLLMPVAREFAPDLVLVAAGFDAAARDPLGGMEASETPPAPLGCLSFVARGCAALPSTALHCSLPALLPPRRSPPPATRT